MMKGNVINRSATILEAIARLNELPGGLMTLFVTDGDGCVVGTLTDGDVRRALLAGVKPEDSVTRAVNTSFKALHGPLTSSAVKELRELRRHGITLVPRLDSDGRILEIIDLRATPTRLPISALLMAGGKGERLRPLTNDCPKPLLKIGGKAIIDYNVEALAECGVRDITVATRYLAEQLEEHFSAPVAGVKVKCVREREPLGTIGAASLIDYPAEGSTLVMNSDLITDISFEEMFLKHHESGAEITMAVIPYNVTVPFAILSLDGERVEAIQEKPSYSYYANAGIYLIKNRVLRDMPRGVRMDAPELIESVIDKGRPVTYFPIEGTWIDVGSPNDFRQACELMNLRIKS